jgi:hypothetical protein
MKERLELYASRARQWQAESERLGARSRLVGNFRGLCFGSAAISGIAAISGADPALCGPLALLLLGAFFVLVVVHGKVIDAFDLAERWVDVNRDAQSRLEHRWDGLPDIGEGLATANHPYASDLDLFGRGSLFQRLSVARTRFGRERLAELLCSPATLSEVQRRQSAVRALSEQLELRQSFEAHALGMVGSHRPRAGAPRVRSAPNPAPLLAWAESEPALHEDLLSVWGSRLLPPLTAAAAIGAFGFGMSALPVALGLLLQLVVIVRSQREINRVFQAVSVTEGAFLRYGALLSLLEHAEVDDPLLRELKDRLNTKSGTPPSQSMARVRSLVGWFDLRHNGLVHPIVNWLLLWDLHCALALERWQRDTGKRLRDWFEVIGWFEALSSLASFAADEPGICYPELREGSAVFRAKGLCHPLIDATRRVANDVELNGPGSALLVTGSNMSGKSTLLRAMGVSTVLALTGAPVVARRLELSLVEVATSIRVADSLEHGVSHFYAEITKLKAVVDRARERGPVLFLLDEILHGTNSRERQVGARWVLAELLKLGALGALSTHDEELCRLPPELMQQVALVHLRESVENGRMTFDYLVYPGPVTAGNALRLMRQVGLDVPLE